MNKYIEETYKKGTESFAEEINDPREFFKKDDIFKDDTCEIHPILQAGTKKKETK